MKEQAARDSLLVFGAASVGMWAGWLFFLPASMLMKTSYNKVYTGEGAQLHLAQVILVPTVPRVIGAVAAGLVLGWVTRGTFRSWAVGLVAVLVAIGYGPLLISGTFFAGSAGPLIHSLELIATCVSAPLGLWLGRRIKSDGAVA